MDKIKLLTQQTTGTFYCSCMFQPCKVIIRLTLKRKDIKLDWLKMRSHCYKYVSYFTCCCW